ncbi:Mrp/NBP35 family ATP-binding protein [Paenibacillus sp. 453mf]|uniref:Mrp/NBP35 family ATP-binding protein n=1 Tax=Paenibacillus sp. 453mf TaxID=1761874 RepID=UPI0008E943F3|nr:Mrp/NBP35 family ATP-binding protein [Paenibacillus sp. 453mf]SFS96170.1 ATP-binding protein involved in chromosome partitioning [Paenibacillus sp. 453mf]
MLSRDQVLEVLSDIQEPVSGLLYTDLNFIRDIMVKEDRIHLTLICLTEDENVRRTLKDQVATLLSEAGVNEVHVRLRNASETERESVLANSEMSNKEAGEPTDEEVLVKGHAAGMENNDLLDPASGVHFIAIASGKGGVGKSTVSVNLAAALARQGKRVGIIDADIYGFSVPDMMGIEEAPIVMDGAIQPVERFGVKVMSMGFFVQENSPVVWRGPMLGKMLRQFFSDVNWGSLDYMILDLPPGTGDIALDVHQMIPQSKEIIVTTPHATAAFVAARAGAMAIQTQHEVLGVIENMAYYQCGSCGDKDYVFGRGGGGRLAESLHTELLAQIPLGNPDNHISEPDFSPSVYKDSTEIGRMYNDVAAAIIDKTTNV